jgi:hypothetical protein
MGIKLTIIIVIKDNLMGFELTYNSLLEYGYVNCNDIEILVVDSSRVRINQNLYAINYYFVPPSGVFSAMNHGMQKAKGNYVYFLNSSDQILYFKDKLLNDINKKSDVFYFNIESSNRFEYPLPLSFLKLGEIPFSHQGVIVNRHLCAFSKNLKNVADMELFLKLYKANKQFTYVNALLARIAPMKFARKYRIRQATETYKVLLAQGLILFVILRFFMSIIDKKMFRPNYIEKL